MLKLTLAAMLAVMFLVLPQTGLAQTAAEQLQKGIFAEQTQGNLDEAIVIYRQLANSALSQRDIAAQAQYRLALALLQKGDMTGASGEFQRLAQNYADYRTLISNLASRASHAGAPLMTSAVVGAQPAVAGARPTFERGAFVNLTGKVVQMSWVNPVAYVTIETGIGQYSSFALVSPNTLMSQQVTRNSIVLGMMLNVVGNLADDGRTNPISITTVSGEKITGSAVVAQANTVTRLEDNKIVFDRAKLPPPGTNGTITGRITDPQGRAVVLAQVSVRNTSTGMVYPGTTTDTGNYSVGQLPAGIYQISVEAAGFKRYSRENVANPVAPGQVVRLDVRLE